MGEYCNAVSFMLTVVYTECHKLAFMLYAYMLNIVMLSVVLPFSLFFGNIKDKKSFVFFQQTKFDCLANTSSST